MNYCIHTETIKPPVSTAVLAWDGLRWVRARYVPKHHEEQGFDVDDWTDYNEKDDLFYWPEGWYELQSHGGDEMLWHLTGGAEYWMHLPPAPASSTRTALRKSHD
jgi:hypothetical protein